MTFTLKMRKNIPNFLSKSTKIAKFFHENQDSEKTTRWILLKFCVLTRLYASYPKNTLLTKSHIAIVGQKFKKQDPKILDFSTFFWRNFFRPHVSQSRPKSSKNFFFYSFKCDIRTPEPKEPCKTCFQSVGTTPY